MRSASASAIDIKEHDLQTGNDDLRCEFSALQEQVRVLHEKQHNDAVILQMQEENKRKAEEEILQAATLKKEAEKEAKYRSQIAELQQTVRKLTPPPQTLSQSPLPPLSQQHFARIGMPPPPMQQSRHSFSPVPWNPWRPEHMMMTPSPQHQASPKVHQQPVQQMFQSTTQDEIGNSRNPRSEESLPLSIPEASQSPHAEWGLGWTQDQEDELLQLKSTIKHAQEISSTASPSRLIEDLRHKLLTLINCRQTARVHVRRAQDIVKEAEAIASPPGFSMMKLKYVSPSHPDMRISEMTGERVALSQQHILNQCKEQALPSQEGQQHELVSHFDQSNSHFKDHASLSRNLSSNNYVSPLQPLDTDSSSGESKSEITVEEKAREVIKGHDTSLPQRVRIRRNHRGQNARQSSLLNHYSALAPTVEIDTPAIVNIEDSFDDNVEDPVPPPSDNGSPEVQRIIQFRKEYISSLMLKPAKRRNGRKWDMRKMRAECERLDIPYTGSQLKKLATKLSKSVQ
jgi:hypothetical protein